MKQIREQLQAYGATELSTLDLLTLTLASTANPSLLLTLARLLRDYPLRRLRQAGVAELQQAGLTRMQAERLVAICELTRRLAMLEASSLSQLITPRDAVTILRPLMEHLDQETLRVLVLNTKNQVLENLELYRGTIFHMDVRIAEIVRPAVLRKAPALLVAHLHPSGDPEPSPSDVKMTKALIQAAKLLDIEIVDHLIIGHARYVSLKSQMSW